MRFFFNDSHERVPPQAPIHWRGQLALASLALGLGSASVTALACDAQRENEIFVDARAEFGRLSGPEKDRLSVEWGELENEQKSLWNLAGEIDKECRDGEVSEQIAPYHARVFDWQDRLRKFLKRMRSPSPAASAKPEPEPQSVVPIGGSLGATEIEFHQAKVPKPTPRPVSSTPATPQPKSRPQETLTPSAPTPLL